MARKTVPKIKQVKSAPSALVLPVGGSTKFGSTPSGGGRAGPLRTSSSWFGGTEEKSRFDIITVTSEGPYNVAKKERNQDSRHLE